MKNKILCLVNTFFNYEHIKKCFDSIYSDNIDYFVMENKSKYSEQIEEYFKSKRLLGYVQAQENITHGTNDYFLQNYKDLINKYEYFTITDGDILVDNISDYYDEVINILNQPRVKVCSISLKDVNLPNLPGAKGWIPNGKIHEDKYMESWSGAHMMTFKKDNYQMFFNTTKLFDTNVHRNIRKSNGVSAVTLKNKGLHLTWDYYIDGNEYFEWKKNNSWVLNPHDKKTEMKKII